MGVPKVSSVLCSDSITYPPTRFHKLSLKIMITHKMAGDSIQVLKLNDIHVAVESKGTHTKQVQYFFSPSAW